MIRFCSLSELEAKGRVTRWIEEWRDELSAFSLDSEIVVVSTVCPHFGGELQREPGTRRLRCKWHSWEFDLDTGSCLTYRVAARLRHYPYALRDGYLEVSLP